MVSTRSNGKFIPGFYNHRSLAKNSIQNKNKITQLFQTKKTKKKTKETMQTMFFIKSLKCFIIKSLKRAKISIKQSKFEIYGSVKRSLIKDYNLNSKYKKCSGLLNDFNIVTKSHISCDSLYQMQLDSFEIKINKTKAVTYKNSNLERFNVTLNDSVSVRFIVEANAQYSKQEMKFLEEYDQNSDTD